MKIKNWLAAAVAVALLGGVLLVGIPAAKASAVGNQSNGQAGQGNRGGYGLQMGRNMGGMGTNVAEFLGISQEDLSAARQAGQSLVQIAAEKGISEQQLLDYMLNQRSTQIDQLVTDSKITQEQAEQHKQFMTERVQENINRTTVGPNNTGDRGFKAGGMGAGMGKGLGRGQGNCGGQCNGTGNGPCATAE